MVMVVLNRGVVVVKGVREGGRESEAGGLDQLNAGVALPEGGRGERD